MLNLSHTHSKLYSFILNLKAPCTNSFRLSFHINYYLVVFTEIIRIIAKFSLNKNNNNL